MFDRILNTPLRLQIKYSGINRRNFQYILEHIFQVVNFWKRLRSEFKIKFQLQEIFSRERQKLYQSIVFCTVHLDESINDKHSIMIFERVLNTPPSHNSYLADVFKYLLCRYRSFSLTLIFRWLMYVQDT